MTRIRKHTRRNGGKQHLAADATQRSPNHIKTLLKMYRVEYKALREERKQYVRTRNKGWLPYNRLCRSFSKEVDTKKKLSNLKRVMDFLVQHRDQLRDPDDSRQIYQHMLSIHDMDCLSFDTLEERIAFQKRCHQVFRRLFGMPFPVMQSIQHLKQRQRLTKSVYVPRSTPKTNRVFAIINLLRREPKVALRSCVRQDDGTVTIEFTHTSTAPNSEELVAETDLKLHVIPPKLTPAPANGPERHSDRHPREQVLASVDVFSIPPEHSGKRKCTQLFANVLKLLQRLDTDVVFLYVGSSTPMKACKCYIRAAATVGLHLVDPSASVMCKNLYRLVFTKQNMQAKYAGLWRTLQDMSADGVSYLLRNYE